MGQEKNEGFEATLDVNIIVLAMIENPAQEEALSLIEKVLKNKIKALIPTTVILGAYLVLVKYYRVERKKAAYSLSQLAKSHNINWYELVKKESLEDILLLASQENIESWDAYLISVMREHGINRIFTINTVDFSKFSWLNPINPISKEKLEKYIQWDEEIHRKSN